MEKICDHDCFRAIMMNETVKMKYHANFCLYRITHKLAPLQCSIRAQKPKPYSNHVEEHVHFRVSPMTTSPITHYTPEKFTRSPQSPPPCYSKRQKEVNFRYSLTNFYWNDVNAIIDFSVHSKFCVYQLTILTAAIWIAQCASSDFATCRRLASVIACCYPELHDLSRMSLNNFPPASLVAFLMNITADFSII